MPRVPNRVYDRLVAGLKRFQPILGTAKARDAGEADTSTIVKDMLSEVFGFDKYTDITSEYLIKGTFCDLAVKLEGKLRILIEVKAIGLELKDGHTKQAADYAANQGIEWVILTNGAIWRIYRLLFAQPISHDLVYEADLLSMNYKNKSQVENLFLFAKEGQVTTALEEFHERGQAKSRYLLGAMVLNDCVIDIMRRELRRVFPTVRIESDELRSELVQEVLKREVTEGDKAAEAAKRILKAQARVLRIKAKAATADGSDSEEEIATNPATQDTLKGSLTPKGL